MKYLFIILLFSFYQVSGQKAYQTGKFTFIIDSSTNIRPTTISSPNGVLDIKEVRTGTFEGAGTLLLTQYDGWLFYFNATPTISNFTQFGTTGAWKISIPTTPTSNKAIFIPSQECAIVFSSNYTISVSNNSYPITVTRNSDGKTMLSIDDKRGIYWPDATVYTVSAFGTTGIILYTLN